MSDKGPMFDLEGCEDVELNKNKTTSFKLLKAKDTKSIKAENNQASLSAKKQSKSWYEKPLGLIAITIISGLIVVFLGFRFGWSG